VKREFKADAPDKLWVSDITYVPTRAGFLYLAVVLDVWSRKVVGWSMSPSLATPLVLAALEMAVRQRQPKGTVHHSDQGCQSTSVAFGQRLIDAGIKSSMGSVGDAYDNAMAESFFSTRESELLARCGFESRDQARREVFSFIEGWYNPRRWHTALGYKSPNEFEATAALAAQPLSPRPSFKPGEPQPLVPPHGRKPFRQQGAPERVQRRSGAPGGWYPRADSNCRPSV
jgi:putative transposase